MALQVNLLTKLLGLTTKDIEQFKNHDAPIIQLLEDTFTKEELEQFLKDIKPVKIKVFGNESTQYVDMLKAKEIGIKNTSQYIVYIYLLEKERISKPIEIDALYYFQVDFDLATKELPLLRMEEETLYRHLRYFEKKEIILFEKTEKKKEYVKILKKIS